jgi:hypothetical protein
MRDAAATARLVLNRDTGTHTAVKQLGVEGTWVIIEYGAWCDQSSSQNVAVEGEGLLSQQ